MINVHDDKITIDIYVQPGAKVTTVNGTHDSKPKIRIAAEPTDGKANKEVIKYFATLLKLPLKNIEIINGDKSRNKRLAIFDTSNEILNILQGLYK
jgi:uncharacterized protein (TIGR00251 family)